MGIMSPHMMMQAMAVWHGQGVQQSMPRASHPVSLMPMKVTNVATDSSDDDTSEDAWPANGEVNKEIVKEEPVDIVEAKTASVDKGHGVEELVIGDGNGGEKVDKGEYDDKGDDDKGDDDKGDDKKAAAVWIDDNEPEEQASWDPKLFL